ncbi:GNAT family protein [Fulvimarina sp. 2208YS6-2-32]|uniref:GNAT family protein n=1 Tax=Fulvimarina uroteuthidis TaxID=3098149 RepID=A0ABU5I620_9HYPH|nr:GNAT family protein [Fulvimarina sp. 2208YS6-2-32]MDY8110259.1 GNAT family protein [Fulvimarina sp. 2208YS6-2-32]
MTNGDDLRSYEPRRFPGLASLIGRFATLEPIVDDRAFGALWQAYSADTDGELWRWMHDGPFADEAQFRAFAARVYLQDGHRFYAIVPNGSGRAAGVAALFRADLANGVIEIGHICLAPSLQRTPAATEAFHLIMRHVIRDLGYRRLEWKCNDENVPSKRAAERLGLRFEGVFRQHQIVKGRNRDTAWYAVLDREWAALEPAFATWLDAANFDRDGMQRRSLGSLTSAASDLSR